MNHITKKIISLLFVMCFIFLSIFQSFAKNAKLNISEVSGNIEEIIKININIANAEFSKAELKLEYNTSELSFEGFEAGYISGLFSKTESGEYSKGNLYFRTINKTDILTGGTFCSAKFKILKDNNRSPIRTNLTAYSQNGFRVSVPSAISYINSGTFKTDKSSPVLNELNLYAIYGNNSKTEISISPKFSPNNYSYICNIEDDASKIAFSAFSKDGEVSIIGNSQLSNGENNFKIIVDGNNNNRITYNILINKITKNQVKTSTDKFINTDQTTRQSGIISEETKTDFLTNNTNNENNTIKNTYTQKPDKKNDQNHNKKIEKNKIKITFAIILLMFSLLSLSGFVYFYYLDFIKINKHKKDSNNEKNSL